MVFSEWWEQMTKGINFVFIILILIILSSCASDSGKPIEQNGFYMGTIISEKVYGAKAGKAANEVMEKIKNLEQTMTINSPGSEIDKLNDMAGKESVKLSSESIFVMKTAKKYSELSEGTFDVTVGPLVKAWGIFTDHPRIPEKEEIKTLLKLVGYKDLFIDDRENSAKLARQGEVVDLGGIAKGYAGDAAIDIFKSNGIKSAYINLGGNVVVLGSKPDGSPWNIGIQNPRAANGKYIGILKVSDKAVVSSGDYERYFEKDNIRYHHILDPRTGYPSDTGLMGTTIVTRSSIDADALSTATFVLGLDKGMKLVESLKNVEAVFITKEKKVYITPGLKNIFTFEDESKEFEYVEKR